MTDTAINLVKSLLRQHRVAVLSVCLENGQVHSAAMHYSTGEDGISLFFSTDRRSVKCAESRHRRNGAAVIGWSERDWVTTQIRGAVIEVQGARLPHIRDLHYQKHPSSAAFADDPNTVFLELCPRWLRYSNLGTEPAQIHELTFDNG